MSLLQQLEYATALADSFATCRRSVTVTLTPRGARVIGVRFGQERRERNTRWEHVERDIVGEVRLIGAWTREAPDTLDVES